jgi:hypothetical protein
MYPVGLCRCVPVASTSARGHGRKTHVLPGQTHSRHISEHGPRPTGRRIDRLQARSELACDGFRCGCCCTLLLYQALEPWAQDFELCF